MMKMMFFLAAITVPISLIFNQAAVGLIVSLIFFLLAAYFSKPRFGHRN